MNSETEYVIEISMRNMRLVVLVTVLIQKQERSNEEEDNPWNLQLASGLTLCEGNLWVNIVDSSGGVVHEPLNVGLKDRDREEKREKVR